MLIVLFNTIYFLFVSFQSFEFSTNVENYKFEDPKAKIICKCLHDIVAPMFIVSSIWLFLWIANQMHYLKSLDYLWHLYFYHNGKFSSQNSFASSCLNLDPFLNSITHASVSLLWLIYLHFNRLCIWKHPFSNIIDLIQVVFTLMIIM